MLDIAVDSWCAFFCILQQAVPTHEFDKLQAMDKGRALFNGYICSGGFGPQDHGYALCGGWS